MAKYIFIKDELKPHLREIGDCDGRLVDFLKTKDLINPKIVLNDKDVLENFTDDYILKDDDTIVIINQVKWANIGWAVVKFVIAFAVSYAINRLLAPDKPSMPKRALNDEQKDETEFTINTSQNQARNGQPIPECFGTYVRTPDIISAPYRRFVDNKEYLYMLLCIGVGENTVNEVFIEDTPISSFTDDTVSYMVFKNATAHTGNDKIKDAWASTITTGRQVFTNYAVGSALPLTQNLEVGGFESRYAKYFFSFSYYNAPLPPDGEGGTNYDNSSITVTFTFAYKHLGVTLLTESKSYTFSPVRETGYYSFNVEKTYDLGQYDEVTITSSAKKYSNPVSITPTLTSCTLDQNVPEYDNYFRDVVITAKEIENFKLTTATKDLMGEIQLNPTNTIADLIEVDIILPSLYTQNSDSSLSNRSVQIRITYTDSQDTVTVQNETITGATRNEIRKTFSYAVSPDTYRIKVERITAESTSSLIQDDVYLDKIKAYLVNNDVTGDGYIQYGDLTLMAVRIKATEGISSKGQFKVKVNATRDGKATLKDIIEYVWTADNGGRQSINDINLPAMSESYNSVISNRTTVFKTIQSVATSQRYNLYPSFNIITAKKDVPQPIRTMLFNEANIVMSSLVVTTSSKDETDYDGVRVIYRNPLTFENEFEVYPTNASFPEDIELDGVTDLAFAKEQAEFLYKQDIYRNVKYQFDTELDGFVPSLYDRVGISHPTISISQAGMIVAFDTIAKTVTLNETIKEEYTDLRILFRNRLGIPSAIYTVLSVDGRTLTLNNDLPTDLYVGDDEQKTIYALGEGTTFIKDIIVTEIKPKKDNVISITGWNYNDIIYPT